MAAAAAAQTAGVPAAASATEPPFLSVGAPVYFEQEVIGHFLAAVTAVLARTGWSYEIVLVDDGSTDRTVALIREAIAADSHIRLVEFSYNHGKAAAMTAGLTYASGTRVLCMDPDLQDPPECIPEFVAKLDEGYDVVLSVREAKAGGPIDRLLSAIFWTSLRSLTRLDLPPGLGTMRIFNRHFVEQFLRYPEANRFLEGLLVHVGMRRTQIVVPHRARFAGQTKFNLRRRFALASSAITDFSEIPLRLATRVGLAVTAVGLFAMLAIVFVKLFIHDFQLGWPSLFCLLITGFGVNLLFLGIIGTYVGKIYREVKGRPLFSIRGLHNLEPRP